MERKAGAGRLSFEVARMISGLGLWNPHPE
jgi:hypothetical protein